MPRKRIQSVTFSVTASEIRGQGRPRFAIIGGKPRAYKADEDKAWERAIRDAYINSASFKDMAGFADEVHVMIQTRKKLPASAPKCIVEQADTFKPDVDNIAKSVLDALNRLAFKDDKQVTRLSVEKFPRTRRDDEIMEVTIVYYAEVGTH